MIPNPKRRLRIVVLGYIVRGPIGGRCWADLHYLLGLAQLGHDVYFIEDSDDYPSCYNPKLNTVNTDSAYGLTFATKIFKKVGFENKWAYYDAHTSKWFGPCANKIHTIFKTSDLLLNLGAVNPLRPWLMEIPIRVFIDKDPAFTQIRIIKDPSRKYLALQHNRFFTLGENINLKYCSIPKSEIVWEKTRHPIFLDSWPAIRNSNGRNFTTVMQWDSYRKHEYKGVVYGLKSDSFRDYLTLPKTLGSVFDLAVGSTSAPRDLLRSHGWNVLNPLKVTRTPWMYQRFIQRSKAEFSIAKHGYVISDSGWFSERTASYLASGKPALVQETGFSKWMETGLGIISFHNRDQALAGIEDINSRYKTHSHAAREIAEEYFDSRKLLNHFIDTLTT